MRGALGAIVRDVRVAACVVTHDTHMTHYTGHSGVSWAAVSRNSQDQSQDLIKAYPYDIPPYRLWPSSRVGLPGFETLPRWACRYYFDTFYEMK